MDTIHQPENPEPFEKLAREYEALQQRHSDSDSLERKLTEAEAEKNRLAEENAQLRDVAERNDVTGHYGLRRLKRDLPQIVGEYEQNPAGKCLYVAMIDIDNFGKFNKRYGHQIGDIVLRAVADILDETMRKKDHVDSHCCEDYHLHGEEWEAVYICHNSKEAVKVAERLRAAVEEQSAERTGGYQVTISIGVTQYNPNTENFDNASNRADRYMQIAKENGRNQVYSGEEIFPPLHEESKGSNAECKVIPLFGRRNNRPKKPVRQLA